MQEDEQFCDVLADCIDSLTFDHTCDIDATFRPQTVETMGSVRALQSRQRQRIDAEYGARPPSPDFLGTQLLAVYRGEAASVQLAKDSGDSSYPTAISAMSDQQCLSFKKEMKSRIHEWEASVREATGQSEIKVEQKTPLHSIYELYKASKIRVNLNSSTSGTPSGATGAGAGTAAAGASGRQSEPSAVAASRASPSTRVSTTNRRAEDSPSVVSVDRLSVGGVESVSSRVGGGASSTANAATPISGSTATVGGAGGSTTASAAASPGSIASIGNSIARVPIGTTPADQMSDAELAAEKRRLKEVLHRFEKEFQRVRGELPRRGDRREFTREYHRYGQLKDEISRRSGGGGGNSSGAL